MEASANPRFRVTVWPTATRAAPSVGGVIADLHNGAIRYLQATADIQLPPELAIREIPRLDASDPVALLAFTNRWGPLTQPYGDPATLLPTSERPGFLGLEMFSGPRNDLAPIEVVSHHVRALTAVIQHWAWHQWGDDERMIAAWTAAGFNRPRSAGVAWDWWTDHLNAALAPLTVGVVVEGEGRRHGWRRPAVSAYTAMMFQILNDVATETAWRICANEPCGRLFCRQQGRAEAGQQRSSGIRYCTNLCARAQGERDRRRRRAREERQ